MASNTTFTAGISEIDMPNQWIWELSITDGMHTATVGYPLTIDFNIVRNTFASANTGTFNIYNLAPATRAADATKGSFGLFFQDRFNTSVNKFLTFKAGYENNLVTCFFGRIQEAYSHRQGTEVITSIQCMDMGIPTDYVNVTFDAGTKFKDAYKNVAQNAKGIKLGAIGLLEGEFKTPVTLEGSVLEILNKISGGNTFIDNGVVNCLQSNECLDLGVTVLNADSGLINTPQRRGAEIIAEGLFNPNAVVGQLVEVQSKTFSEFCGTFILVGLTHSGTISGAVAGNRTTRYNFLVGAMLPNGKYAMIGTTEPQPFTKVRNEEREPVNGTIGSDIYSVYEHIKSHNGHPPNTKVGKTPYKWVQLLKNDNTYDEIFKEITVGTLQNCKVIAETLYKFLRTNLPGKNITITSNWRSKRNNTNVGGDPHSAHLRGAAIDFEVNNIPTRTAFKNYFYKFWQGFTYQKIFKNGSSIIHVQNSLGKGKASRQRGQQF